MEKKEIVVKSRKEFIDLFKTIFIPADYKVRKEQSEKLKLKEVQPWNFSDNVGFAMNKWTMFFCFDETGTFVSVELVEEKKV